MYKKGEFYKLNTPDNIGVVIQDTHKDSNDVRMFLVKDNEIIYNPAYYIKKEFVGEKIENLKLELDI